MPKGGRRRGAGRPKGAKNKATKEVRDALEELAQRHTDVAINALIRIAACSDSDAASVAAATALLDRGFGRPRQRLEHAGDQGGPIVVEIVRMTDDDT